MQYHQLYSALNAFRELFTKQLVAVSEINHCKDFLKQIADRGNAEMSFNEAFRLYKIIQPYSQKLKQVGFDFDEVPKVGIQVNTPVVKAQEHNVIGYDGSQYIVKLKYNEVLVEKMRQITGRTYDAQNKVWKVPTSSTKELKEFAMGNDFDIGEAAFKMMTDVNDNLEMSYSAEAVELGIATKMQFYPYQTVGVDYVRKNKRVIIADQMGLGKLQSVNSTIITPWGVKRFGDLKVGDVITSSDGKKTEVTGIFPNGVMDLYRVTFTDGFHLDVGLEHLWKVISPNSAEFVLSTKQLIDENGIIKHSNDRRSYESETYYKKKSGNNAWKIPIVKPVEFEPVNLPVSPYLLGVWLGDGGRGDLTIFKNDIDILDFIDYNYKKETARNNCYTVRLTNEFIQWLKTNDFYKKRSWEKTIPHEFLLSSVDDRLKLLQGLMDTDGYAGKNSTEYSTTSEFLKNGIVFIVQSLGGIARVKDKYKHYTYKGEKKQGRKSYSINIKLPIEFNLFRCQRKLNAYNRCSKYLPERYIKDIQKVGADETMCISVAASDKLYVTDNFIVTHNTSQGIGGILINNSFPCLVVCPKSLRLNWSDEWEMWTNKRTMILSHKNIDKLPMLIERGLIDVVITNYDGVKTFFVEEIKTIHITEGQYAGTSYKKVVTNGKEKYFKGIVLDESHNCKNRTKLRFKAIKKCFEDKDTRICLTGTPIVKGPQDLAALLDMCGRLEEFGGYHKFTKQYKGMDKKFLNIDSSKPQSKKDRIIQQELKALNIKLRSTCFIRREKHQVLKDLPEKFRKVIRVPLENQKEYDHAYFSLQSYLEKNGASQEKMFGAQQAETLVKIQILKQLSSKGKLEAVKEFAEDLIEQGEKMIIVCWFNETVQLLKDALKEFGVVTISGKIDGIDTKDEEIQEAKKKFMNDPSTKIIIITYGKGGEGHTLTAASKVLVIELGWTYKDQGQVEDRAHRIGQKSEVECYYFIGQDTIDEHIYNIINSRMMLEKQATGGSEEIQTTFTSLIAKIAPKSAN